MEINVYNLFYLVYIKNPPLKVYLFYQNIFILAAVIVWLEKSIVHYSPTSSQTGNRKSVKSYRDS